MESKTNTDAVSLEEALRPCPFCGGAAERVDIEDGESAGGSCISCTVCQASSNVEFEFKENFVSNWNRRAALAHHQSKAAGTTHAPGCWSWGPEHYQCAVEEVGRLKGASEPDEAGEYTLGRVTWHCSEEGGGPDVGLSLGLGDGRMLWLGEMADQTLEEHGIAVGEGRGSGWWMTLYDGDSTSIAAEVVDTDAGRRLFDAIALLPAHQPRQEGEDNG